MSHSIQTWTCHSCGAHCSRDRARGQVPKWCDDCRRRSREGDTCSDCGTLISRLSTGRCKPCVYAERVKAKKPTASKRARKDPAEIADARRANRSPLRASVEDRNHASTIAAILSSCDVDGNGCWLWKRKLRRGYPVVNLGGKYYQVHRLSLESG